MNKNTTIQALHFKANGNIEILNINKDNLLKDLQKAVGGYIEIFKLGDPQEHKCLVLNEEGRLFDLPLNPHFTKGFYGDVVLIETDDLNGGQHE